MDVVVDIDHLKTWIGREEVVADVVTADLTRKFRAMLNLGGDHPKDGDIAPRLIHFCLAQPAAPTASLGPDGHPARGGFLPPVPLPRRMWAGGVMSFMREFRVGDRVERRSRIADVAVKEGRTGVLCFVTVEHAYHVDGEVAVTERQDLVYRALESGGSASTPVVAEPGVSIRTINADAVLLFRYSALTFNGHRIHYDRRYCIDVEGYPGLIVHGPLQATLLMQFAAEQRDGVPPNRFAFRSQATLFDDDPFMLNAAALENGELIVWTAKAGGPVAMRAEARWD